MLLSLVSLALTLAGTLILARSRARYHRVVGVLLLLTAVTGLVVAWAGEFKVPVGRDVVLVTNQDLEPQAFNALFEAVDVDTPVKVIRVTTTDEPSQNEPFRVRGEFSTAAHVKELAQRLRPNPASWLADSLSAAVQELEARRSGARSLLRRLRQPTIVVAFDADGDFGVTASDRGLDAVNRKLLAQGIELFLLDVGERFHRSLEITLPRRTLPVAPLSEITDQIFIDVAPEFREVLKDGKPELFVAVDDEPTRIHRRTDVTWEFPMNVRLVPSSGAGAGVLRSGFHRVAARIESVQPDGHVIALEGTTYVQAARALTKIYTSDPTTVRNGLRTTLGSVSPGRANWLSSEEWSVEPLSKLTIDPVVRTVIVDRPSAEDMKRLQTPTAELLIREGVNLQVLEPPTGNYSVLPSTTDSFEGSTTEIHHDRRLYFLVDYSRVSEHNDDAGLKLQRDRINQVLQSIRGVPGVQLKGRVFTGLDRVYCSATTGVKDLTQCSSEDLKVIPPIGLVDLARDHVRELYALSDQMSWGEALRRELLPSMPSAQIAQLFADDEPALLTRRGLYPNTTVILFSRQPADVSTFEPTPQWARRIGERQPTTYRAGKAVAVALKDLTDRGIKVVVHWLPVPDGFDYYRAESGPTALNLPRFDANRAAATPDATRAGVAIHPVVALADSSAFDAQVKTALDGWTRFAVVRLSNDRTFDPRLPERETEVPSSASALQVTTGTALASITGSGGSRPAIIGSRIGEGYVNTYAFSPLRPELLAKDSRGVASYGVQRLLDAHFIGNNFRPTPSTPQLEVVEELQDGGTVLFHCTVPLGQGQPMPRLELDGVALGIAGLNVAKGTVTFQFRSPTAVLGAFRALRFHSDDVALPGTTDIFVSLRGANQPGRTTKEILSSLSAVSGGGQISTAYPTSTNRAQIASFRSGTWALGLLLAFLLAILFSPVVRPWVGAKYWIRRLRYRARNSVTPFRPVTVRLDVKGILADWGQNRGRPASTRTGGEPGSQKRFEPGDSLALARKTGLVAFTSLGRSLRLPPARPLLRQREFQRTLRAYLCLDATGSLYFPDAADHRKFDFTVSIAFLVAQILLARGAQIILVDCPGQHTSTPLSAGITLDEFREIVRAWPRASRRAQLSTPSDAVSGELVLLVTDLLARCWDGLPRLVESALNEGLDVRLVHVTDSAEFQAVGMVWDVDAAVVHDRGSWDETELIRRHRELTVAASESVQLAGGRFVALNTGDTDQEVASAVATVLE